MDKTRITQTKEFIAKASMFVSVTAILDYLFIFTINIFTNNYVTELFDVKILLVIAIVSGFTFVLTKD